jgi:putative membrane protein
MTDDPGAAPDDTEDDPHPDVRFSYANERTFLAWNRTALAMVTAGLAITQLLPPFDVPGGRRLIGIPLITIGTLVAVASFFQWQRNEAAMRAARPLPKSILPALVAAAVALSAVIALVLAAVGSSGATR